MAPPSPRLHASIVAGTIVLATGLAVWIARTGSIAVAIGLGAILLVGGLHIARAADPPADRGRRRFLATAAGAGVGVVAAAPVISRVVERLAASADREILDEMARSLGAPVLRSIVRGYDPERSGDLQLVLTPFSTANYPHESRSLRPQDPRSSHALPWSYTDRVPLVLWGPGLVAPRTFTEEATLADLAPTTAALIGAAFDALDGRVLPGVERPPRPPKLIVTLVIDGGGWNVLQRWPAAWPNLARLMREGANHTNAFMGSFPNVTASAHATIGTGAFPRTHGIPGHHVRYRGEVTPAWGGAGVADPGFLRVPTLADVWSEETRGRAWIGELGYQVWHLGMIGAGGDRPLGEPPVGVFWDESADDWAPHNRDLYRLPAGTPSYEALAARVRAFFGPAKGQEVLDEGGRALCCDPPIVVHQGDLIEAAIEREEVGGHEATDLLYINYKAPDYAGHTYNMLAPEERVALEAVDAQIGRLARQLSRRFAPGEYALIVTADHGQCPLVDGAGGVRLDPIQLTRDLEERFGRSLWPLVENLRPSEMFVHRRARWDGGVTLAEIATSLAGYRYRDNIGPYVPDEAIDHLRLGDLEFAAILPGDHITGIDDATIAAAGGGAYPASDPGIPPPIWR